MLCTSILNTHVFCAYHTHLSDVYNINTTHVNIPVNCNQPNQHFIYLPLSTEDFSTIKVKKKSKR